MVKLHFLEEEDDPEEDIQLQAPKLKQFKPRKLKSNFGSTAKANSSTLSKQGRSLHNSSLFTGDESDEEEYLSVFQGKLSSNSKKKTFVAKAPIAEAAVKGISSLQNEDQGNKKVNVKDYLKSYESTTESAILELTHGDNQNSEEREQDTAEGILLGENVEGHIISGSDLDSDGNTEMPLQNDLNVPGPTETTKTRITPKGPEPEILPHDKKKSAMRRKQIEQALSETNLDDLDNFESFGDGGETDGRHARGFVPTGNVEVIGLDLQERHDLCDSKPVLLSKRHKKAQFIFHTVAPLEEQLKLTQEKLTSLSDIVSKRELQMNHLKTELGSITNKTAQYAQRMSQALCNCS